MSKVKIWDGKTSINGISAEEILANRNDLARALGDIFLVVDDSEEIVSEIQIGKIISSNYGFEAGLSLQEIADKYMEVKAQEALEAEKERLTTEELQEEVALLSYEVMSLREPVVAVALAEGEHSPKFELIRRWFNRGFWTEEMVQNAVSKNVITAEEAKEILGK